MIVWGAQRAPHIFLSSFSQQYFYKSEIGGIEKSIVAAI